MREKLVAAVTIAVLLVLVVLLVLGGTNLVYGKGKRVLPSAYCALSTPACAVADVAVTDLAGELGVADRIVVLDVDPASFPNTSLGVIEPGKRYLDALTSGYTVRLWVSGQTYTYHTSGDRIVLLPKEHERSSAVQRLIRTSVSDVRDRLDVGLDEVVVQSIEGTEFPDGSLGAPEPNVPYPLAPTPGYEILLQVKGVVYRYWAVGDRVVYVGAFLEPDRKVTVYLHRDLNSEAGQCGAVYPVERAVPVTSEASSIVALQQLFAGPTEDETARGYVSPFSKATAGLLTGIRVEGRTAYVDVASALPGFLAGSDCSREAFLAETEATLKETLPVQWVVYSVEGHRQAFCQWMGWCE